MINNNQEETYRSNLQPSQVENKRIINRHPESIGACWRKFNDKNIEYLSLKIEINGITHNLKCFLNSEKRDGDLKPDFICYKSKNIKK